MITTLGARMGAKKPIDNWFIHTLIQWSADATEHAHVSEIKDPL
jgi:hypothetical protein